MTASTKNTNNVIRRSRRTPVPRVLDPEEWPKQYQRQRLHASGGRYLWTLESQLRQTVSIVEEEQAYQNLPFSVMPMAFRRNHQLRAMAIKEAIQKALMELDRIHLEDMESTMIKFAGSTWSSCSVDTRPPASDRTEHLQAKEDPVPATATLAIFGTASEQQQWQRAVVMREVAVETKLRTGGGDGYGVEANNDRHGKTGHEFMPTLYNVIKESLQTKEEEMVVDEADHTQSLDLDRYCKLAHQYSLSSTRSTLGPPALEPSVLVTPRSSPTAVADIEMKMERAIATVTTNMQRQKQGMSETGTKMEEDQQVGGESWMNNEQSGGSNCNGDQYHHDDPEIHNSTQESAEKQNELSPQEPLDPWIDMPPLSVSLGSSYDAGAIQGNDNHQIPTIISSTKNRSSSGMSQRLQRRSYSQAALSRNEAQWKEASKEMAQMCENMHALNDMMKQGITIQHGLLDLLSLNQSRVLQLAKRQLPTLRQLLQLEEQQQCALRQLVQTIDDQQQLMEKTASQQTLLRKAVTQQVQRFVKLSANVASAVGCFRLGDASPPPPSRNFAALYDNLHRLTNVLYSS